MPRNKLRRIPKITERARELRRVMTPAEKVLWQRLRNRAVGPDRKSVV
jgi:very-short-patch-repair endonuclease